MPLLSCLAKCQVRVALDQLLLGRGHALDHVDLAGGQRADADRGLLEEPVGDLVEVGGALVAGVGGRPRVGRVLLVVDLLALGVAVQDERPGADDGRPAGLQVGALERLRRHLRALRGGEEVQDEHVGLLEVHGDGRGVDDLGVLEVLQLGRGDARVVAGDEELVEVGLDGGGVELVAVVEGDAVAELERVGEPVGGRLPRRGQPRQVAALVVVGEQRLEAVPHQQAGLGLGVLVRVEGDRLGLDRPGELAALDGRAVAGGGVLGGGAVAPAEE